MCKKGKCRLTDASPIISLLTDFGLKDPYAAEIKAVILGICPNAHIIDISHLIEKFNVRMGAFVLASASSYFPKGTIHVVVVDPGVGTRRRALLVETEEAFYVGPDNGVLMLAAKRQKIKHAYNITNKRYMLPKVSHTFHGRDIFAPAAAHLAKSITPDNLGPEIKDYLVPEFAEPRLSQSELTGQVLHIDDFGNIVTNISKNDLEKIDAAEGSKLRIKLGKKVIAIRFGSAYGEVKAKTALALIGSHDFLEITVNQSSASKRFKSKIGDDVTLSLF
jgi:S-adenosylmethionine hydrolase